MQALQRAAAALVYPAILFLGVACERAETPTAARSPSALQVSSSGTTHWVNDDGVPVPPGTSCNNPGYQKVQDAVDATAPGDRINVCRGVYEEQVVVASAAKNNIKLISVEYWKAVIKFSTSPLPPWMLDEDGAGFSIVRIYGAQNVTILGFTITGPGPTGCGSLHFGVRVFNGGSANILGNHITEVRDNPFSGCQNGRAVQVGRNTKGSAQVLGNVIDNYQKNGVDVRDAGSSAEIGYNRIFGMGPTTVNAQNGVVVLGIATATIRHNFVAKNIYTVPGTEATGILPFQSGQVVTDRNTVTYNGVDIYMQQAAAGSRTTNNHVRASIDDGIHVRSTGVRVAQNKIERNGGPGIGLACGVFPPTSPPVACSNAAQNNELDDNDVADNNDSGILLDDARNNVVSKNHFRNNGTGTMDLTDGIRINAPSTGNTISDNQLKNNVTHDCHDGSGGNNWMNNRGQTSFPEGLCTKKNDDDDDGDDDDQWQMSTAFGWDAHYPWFTEFGEAAEFDWVAAYAEIDTESLLQLVPTVTGAVGRATASPNP